MNKKLSILLVVFLCLASAEANAFFGKKEKKEEVKKEEVKPVEGNSDVAAKVGSQTITAKELDEAAKDGLTQYAQQIYQVKKQVLDQMIKGKLYEQEAKAQSKSVDEIKKQATTGEITVSDDAIEVMYDSNPGRFGGKPLADVKENIRQMLIQQKMQKGENQLLTDLKKKYPTEIYLEEPKVEISAEGAPSRGPKDAKVTIVEFSEFQCPFCKKFKPTIDQIVKEYPNDVRHVFRHLPLGFHDKAKGAAKASICADNQGKFWEFRDIGFEKAPAIDEASLRTYAEQIGIDMAKYDACLKDPATDKKVDEELAYATKVGARGTPTSFVNGVLFSGAQPYEALKKTVDDKLGKT